MCNVHTWVLVNMFDTCVYMSTSVRYSVAFGRFPIDPFRKKVVLAGASGAIVSTADASNFSSCASGNASRARRLLDFPTDGRPHVLWHLQEGLFIIVTCTFV